MTAAALRAVPAAPTPHRLTTDDVWAMVQAGVIEVMMAETDLRWHSFYNPDGSLKLRPPTEAEPFP